MKHSAMVYIFIVYRTFGYNVLFEISEELNGQIKQEGVSFQFELFVNGESFTSLCNKEYHYCKKIKIFRASCDYWWGEYSEIGIKNETKIKDIK